MFKKERYHHKKAAILFPNFNYRLLLITGALSFFGLLMVYDASVVEAYKNFSDKFYFVKQQMVWIFLGILLMLICASLPIGVFRKISVPAFLFSTILLVLVLLPAWGSKVQGARRWLSVANLTIQPAEITKMTLLLYFASFLEKKRSFSHFIITVVLTAGLIMLEPDLGTAIIVVGIAVSMYYLAGAPLKNMVVLFITGAISIIGFIMTSDYRKARVATFLDPTHDPLGASYHIRQILIALGSGGIFGLGIGKSRQKFEYIPAATTDSIFSIIAEELGFIGSLVLIIGFVVLVVSATRIAKAAPGGFMQLVAGGISAWFALQIILNLSTMVALVPLTGVPLPFISYGGSSTVMNLAAIGLLLNISRHVNKK